MRLLRAGVDDLNVEIEKLAARFRVLDPPVTAEHMERTRKVFGAPLSPAQVVERIVSDVAAKGDEALLDYERRLDGVSFADPSLLKVRPQETEEACSQVSPGFIAAIREARRNIAAFQYHIKPKNPSPLLTNGATLGLEYRPIERVGVYVPAGHVPLPSTVLMTVIPAQVAGVVEIAVATPPDREGRIAPQILAALGELKVREIYKLGGAQAVAALALGTPTVKKVDKIVGPGNAFVALAKRAVFGRVDIDMFAGPSEVLILADRSARADYVAADLLSQAEHVAGTAALVTDSPELAAEVEKELARQIEAIPHPEMAKECLEKYGLTIVVKNVKEAISVANRIAPEHVEIMTEKPMDVVPWIVNAGAVFVGPCSPVAAGDYIAGPSHVLPTGGTARFSSGLSVFDFLKRSSVIGYTETALRAQAGALCELARAEQLEAHARSAEIRLRGRE